MTVQPKTEITDGLSIAVSFHAEATGDPAPTVQWQWSESRYGPWTDIAGATDTTLDGTTTANLNDPFAYGHAFRAVFSNASGTAASRAVRLVSTSNWMRNLGDDIAGIPLTELTIPGTHDMGTYGLEGGSFPSTDTNEPCPHIEPDPLDPVYVECVNYGKAQSSSANAYNELQGGIRYFDLRVCSGFFVEFVTCHGLEGAPLADILADTATFAAQHPHEVIVLDFNHHYELNTDDEAAAIEAAFRRPDGSSMLIPPQYCNPADPGEGICTDQLTLRRIWSNNLGNVIANFQSDQADTDISPPLDADFYAAHPDLWGYWRIGSHFGDDDDVDTVRDRVIDKLTHRETTNTHNLFVEFLQTTPGGLYILEHPFSGLSDMANDSNPVIGPAVFGCNQHFTGCFAQHRPENLNILAINYYERTDYLSIIGYDTGIGCQGGSSSCPLTPEEASTLVCVPIFGCFYILHFDFVSEVINLNEDARTPPIVTVSTDLQPAATGWYNAAVLGGQGQTLPVAVNAQDYRFATGITSLQCANFAGPMPTITSNVPTADAETTGTMALGDGSWILSCSAADGADQGLHGYGNTGAGPGSTPSPTIFLVDTVAPEITCPDAAYILNQPVTSLTGTVTDATSGPASPTASGAVSTAQVGTFTTQLNASDKAGNSSSKICTYTVSYGIALRYDTTKIWNSGKTVPIKVDLVDWNGVDVSSPSIIVTVQSVTNQTTHTVFLPHAPGGSNPTMTFVLKPTRGYQYNVQTTGYTIGNYTLDFTATGDPITHHAPFVIR